MLKLEDNYKKLIDDKELQLTSISTNLQNKEKGMVTLSQTNKKLLIALDALKKEVDERLDKVSYKKISDISKLNKSESQLNLENNLKVKDKELKNAYALIEILKHDINNTNNILGKKEGNKAGESDYYIAYFEEKNKLRYEEKKISELNNEIKLLNKFGDIHKKCIEKQTIFEKEKKQLREELHMMKDKYKELNKEKTEEQRPHIRDGEGGANTSMRASTNRSFTSGKLKQKQKHVKKASQNESFLNKSNQHLDKSNSFNETNNSIERKAKHDLRSSIYIKNNLNLYSRNKGISEEELKLFKPEIRKKIEKVLSATEIETLEKKYDSELSLRISLDNKLKHDAKIYAKEIATLHEQVEFLNLQNKESEQKIKIFTYQVNEKTTDHKLITKKLNENLQLINENQHKIDENTRNIKEKDIKISNLSRQINVLKSEKRKNAVSPNKKTDKSDIILSENQKSEARAANKKLSRFHTGSENKDDYILSDSIVELIPESGDIISSIKVNSKDETYNIDAQNNKGIDN